MGLRGGTGKSNEASGAYLWTRRYAVVVVIVGGVLGVKGGVSCRDVGGRLPPRGQQWATPVGCRARHAVNVALLTPKYYQQCSCGIILNKAVFTPSGALEVHADP